MELLLGAGVLAATLRLATPIAFAALGGVITERSGVTNIALEGCMLVGAFFGIFIADKSGNLFVALAAAVLAGVALAAVHALAAITFRADQIVSGMALNILALGRSPAAHCSSRVPSRSRAPIVARRSQGAEPACAVAATRRTGPSATDPTSASGSGAGERGCPRAEPGLATPERRPHSRARQLARLGHEFPMWPAHRVGC